MVAIYSRCLSSLRRKAFRAKGEEKVEIERTILYVFLRFVCLAQEAGYDELAIAAIQATIELNIFRPSSTHLPISEQTLETELSHFEEFWDSEVPRFGEENARGWKAFDPDQDPRLSWRGQRDAGSAVCADVTGSRDGVHDCRPRNRASRQPDRRIAAGR